jgi:hypothetical protein
MAASVIGATISSLAKTALPLLSWPVTTRRTSMIFLDSYLPISSR